MGNSKKSSTSSKRAYNKKSPIRPATASRAVKDNSRKTKKKKQNLPLILLGIAILIITWLVIPGGRVWLWAKNLLLGLFSKGAYFLPVVLIYIAYIYENKKISKNFVNLSRKSLYLFLLILTLNHILFGSDMVSSNSFLDFISLAFFDGMEKTGGGLIAAIIAWPFLNWLGFGGAVSVVSISIFILVMIISKITLTDLFKAVYAPAKKIETIYNDRSQKKHKMTNIDVPLDGFPAHPVESPKRKKTSLTENDSQNLRQEDNLNLHEELNNIDEINFIELESFNNKTEIQATKREEQASYDIIDTPDDFEIEFDRINTAEEKNIDSNQVSSSKEENAASEIDLLITNKINEEKVVVSTDQEENKEHDNLIKENFLSTLMGSSRDTQQTRNLSSYNFPSVQLLNQVSENGNNQNVEELKNTAQKLVDTLKSFGVSTKILDFSQGPAVTRYELQPASGVKISKITGLADDIALNLAAAGVRIEAPIPNKAAVGIEVPNKNVSIVGIRSIVDSQEFKNNKSNLAVALGKDISGNIAVADLAKMPHILIAGSTGSGKSVCINSIIISLIYKSSPDDVRLIMVDPKVVELGVYNDIPHLLIPVVTDPKRAAGALNWAVSEMLKRHKIFAETGVRDLKGYNALASKREDLNTLPQIVIIIDELADLMMVAPNEIEDSICRLAQMARAAGMHLVIATQRPSVDVITGIIKANIPSRIAFAVSSQVDSRTIIDSSGAEKLLGRGDMLFYPMGSPKPTRVQGCFVSDREVENVVAFIKNSYQSDYDDEISQEIERLSVQEKGKGVAAGSGVDEDEMFLQATECAVENGEVSTSFLQRKLKIGYSRAARLIDEMEERGIVGSKDGSKPRKTLISRQEFIEMKLNSEE